MIGVEVGELNKGQITQSFVKVSVLLSRQEKKKSLYIFQVGKI